MANLLVKACTMATLASAALAERKSAPAALALAPAPGLPAPAPAPAVKNACHAHGNVTVWKAFNGDQPPGLGAALLPPHYKTNAEVPGYVCITGTCAPTNIALPTPFMTPADYLTHDPNYGPRSLDNDLQNFAGLQNITLHGNATDACFGYHLTQAFAGQPVLEKLATNPSISLTTHAAFLQSFWSDIPDLSASLQQFPDQVPVYYDFIVGYKHSCSDVLGDYIGLAHRP